ncbi:Aspartyl-tRNA synthetase [Plasmodium coatneyi]|uniref:aspartate--tRNA ligase n=1 Tax=Plasmodium coatneyi TaxID=208452 RepID=A0A1B1E0U2_9APIC|nr:Aspartyl-tRNA synthetase [Plasmodium coatneyi]ANQ08652.1 Aspartyl-tRNA synthetase [Plasmodium coatneyi]
MKLARGVLLLWRIYMMTYLQESILCYRQKGNCSINLSRGTPRREQLAYVRSSVGRSPRQCFSNSCLSPSRIHKRTTSQLSSLFGGDVSPPVGFLHVSDKTRRGLPHGKRKKYIHPFSCRENRSSAVYIAKLNGEGQEEHPRESDHSGHAPLLHLTQVGDFSFFYGTGSRQNCYSTYEQIVHYIEQHGGEFSSCSSPPSEATHSEGSTKKTIIDQNYTLIRGRVEQKVKQSKRIFLRLRQEGGVYLTCVYEKKGRSTEWEDPLHSYIKKIRNESVVDIVGHVKVHGDLSTSGVPFLESILNEKCIEIVVRSIQCISEAFDDVPVMVNEGRAFWAAQKCGVIVSDGNKHDGNKHDGNEHDGNKHDGANKHDGNKHDDDGSTDGVARRPTKLNTSEVILKLQHPSLHHRHPMNHLVFQMKNRIAQQLREMLRRDGYTEVFTSKLVDLGGEHTAGDAGDAGVAVGTTSASVDGRPGCQLNGSEGGSRCYKIEGEKVILAQSPQFYKQMLINADFERIYEMNYSYRNEKFNTSRHLNEFLSLDIERVLYQNYYEIIIPMYNLLKRLNGYMLNTFGEELSLISSFFGGYHLEPSKFPDVPFVLSFCEAKDILHKYYSRDLNATTGCSPLDMQEGGRKKSHVGGNFAKEGVRILTNEEKEELKKRLSFEAPPGDMLHNVYFNQKVENTYRIYQGGVPIDGKSSSGQANQQEENVYAFLNRFDRDELYKRVLLFLNRLYEGGTTANAPVGTDGQVECKYSMLNLLRKNPHEEGDEVYVTESAHSAALKEKYLHSPDFTNEELQFLHQFLKKNFDVDLFIIDQYPWHLRPYYTAHNLYDMRFTNSFDFFYKGVEIISGSQRINHLPILLFKVVNTCGSVENPQGKFSCALPVTEKTNFSLSDYLKKCEDLIDSNSTLSKYINSFRFGSKPHGGLALGFERYLLAALNLGNVKRAVFCE